MPRLQIILERDELAALADLGMRERRTPRDPAGHIIAEVLRREGLTHTGDLLNLKTAAGVKPASAAGAR